MNWITYYKENSDLEAYKRLNITKILVGEPFASTRIPYTCTLEKQKEILKQCNQLQLKMGVLMNRLFFDEDKQEVISLLKEYKTMQVDSIEYCDPMVYVEAKKLNMEHLLIYNSDTLMCNALDVQTYLDLGIKGVVISKEITLQEIIAITKAASSKVGTLIFGRSPMAYSKRHLISNYLKEIESEEDVRNAQDCILIETTREGKIPIVEDEHGTTIYSDYTLAAFDELKILQECGLSDFYFNNNFISEDVFLACLGAFNSVDKEGSILRDELNKQHQELDLTLGFMYQKTNLVK